MKLDLHTLALVMGGKLSRGNPGMTVSGVSTDSRSIKPGSVFFALKGENFDGHKFVRAAAKKGAKAAVVQKGFGEKVRGMGLIELRDPLFALGELARFERAGLKARVIGVTGSVGKTTTKEMIAAALMKKFRTAKSPGNFNNLIGLPLAIFGIDKKAEAAVLELASNRPGEIARLSEIAQPDIGVITRIAPVHLQGFRDLDGVEKEKRALAACLGPKGVFIFNLNDERLCRIALGFAGEKVGFGVKRTKFKGARILVWAEQISMCRSGGGLVQKFKVKTSASMDKSEPMEVKGMGEHLVENALAAAATGLAMGLTLGQIASGLKKFEPVRGRGGLEKTPAGVWLIDESYNANPESMRRALSVFSQCGRFVKGKKILVLGEMAELGEYSEESHFDLGAHLHKVAFNQLYYLGDFSRELKKGLGRIKADAKVAKGLEELRENLKDTLAPGDLVMVKGSHVTGLHKIADRLREKNAL